MNPFESPFANEGVKKMMAEAGEKIMSAGQPNQAVQKTGQDFRASLKAQIGLPEQIDKLAEQIGKLVEVASAQKQLAEEAGKQAENLSEQTDRLVQETIALTKFTRVLVWLTVFIGLSAIIQIVIMLFEYFTKTK